MKLYRIANSGYAGDLSGTGAKLYGGRWNRLGTAMVYLASSRSLAVLEVLVHLPATLIKDNFSVTEFEFTGYSTFEFDVNQLPENWNEFPAPAILQSLGEHFIKANEFLLMKVPSAIVDNEFNYLLNPHHELLREIKLLSLKHFKFDQRLKS